MQQGEQHVHRFVSDDLTIRVASVDATAVVEKMRQTQNTLPLSTIAVGRTMVGALLMASHLKGDQEVALDFHGDGPLQRVYAQANVNGGVRGYASEPGVGIDTESPVVNLAAAMGSGTLSVLSYQPFKATPHRGVVDMVSGEIGEDLAHYYSQSFQVPTVISLGVHLDSYGRVNAAGGVLIEMLPGADLKVIEMLEKNVEGARGVSLELLDGKTPEDIARSLTKGLTLTELEHPFPVHYYCPCTRDRLLRSLELLGLEELDEIVAKDEVVESQCQMCGTWYHLSVEEISQLIEKIRKAAMH